MTTPLPILTQRAFRAWADYVPSHADQTVTCGNCMRSDADPIGLWCYHLKLTTPMRVMSGGLCNEFKELEPKK